MIAVTAEVEALARAGAWFAFSVSGGKDSGASLHAGNAWLDTVGHPRDRRIAIHADLGRAEWPETLDVVQKVSNRVGIQLEIVKQRSDLLWRFEDRWRRSLNRYERLETINLVPPWSSSSLLFCRSEQKLVPLSRFKAKLTGDQPVVGVVGIRRQESSRRAQAPISLPDGEMLRRNGREGILWHPIAEWSVDDVIQYHLDHHIPLHRAYNLGSTRLSCALCTIASKGDLTTSILKGGNIEVFRAYSSLEIRSAFSFQSATWLSDLGPSEMVDEKALTEARRIAEERRSIQALLPRTLVKAKSIKGISSTDAEQLAAGRRHIGALYGLKPIGLTSSAILELADALG